MRAAIFNGPDRPIAIERLPDPAPGQRDVVVEVAFCGICGSDVSLTSGTPFDYPHGRCFGHEFAGSVVEVGREVSDLRVGDRVACIPNSYCGHCRSCADGRPLLCSSARPAFGFAEYAVVSDRAAVRLPDSLSLADGATIEPMACGLHALRSAGMQAGDRVLVLGAGTMALAIVWWARALGAGRVVVASRSDARRQACRDFGADGVVRFEEGEAGGLRDTLGGEPDIVAECVGKPGLLSLAIGQVRPGGTVISMGMGTVVEPILPALLTFRETRLLFPLGYSPAEFAETAARFDAVGFRPARMVSDVVPLDRLGPTMAAIRAGGIKGKVHVDPRSPA